MHETSTAKPNLLRWGHEFRPQVFWAGLTSLDLLGLDIPDPTLGLAGPVGPTSLGLTQSSFPIYYTLIYVSAHDSWTKTERMVTPLLWHKVKAPLFSHVHFNLFNVKHHRKGMGLGQIYHLFITYFTLTIKRIQYMWIPVNSIDKISNSKKCNYKKRTP